jgi:hypothetical protein
VFLSASFYFADEKKTPKSEGSSDERQGLPPAGFSNPFDFGSMQSLLNVCPSMAI